ncbi:MAG: GyrI-like domain-containing protein [Dactylosporangium sp.]|nr:GyrI-like domain-containing protein [Dactylosporangium sp.]NNJ60423.1 GyrI-like domain-containing protein [Dactylosporangium sp.]
MASVVEPRIEHHPCRALAGIGFFGDPFRTGAGWTEENEIGRLWHRLLGYLGLPECPYAHPAVFYEVHVRNQVTPVTGEYEVFIGFEPPPAAPVPVELCLKHLPEADYAVFSVRGDQVQGDECIVDGWLASAGYEVTTSFGIQRYDHRFLGLDRLDESELDLMVPLRPRESR